MADHQQDTTTSSTAAANTNTSTRTGTVAAPNAAQSLLPKCICNWKFCRTYQKYFCEYQDPLFCGVVKLRFTKANPKSMAFKAVVERALRIPEEKRNTSGAVRFVYHVSRHHFTEALIKQYLADRRAWDWNEPLNLKQAKTYLWSLDRCDIYKDSIGDIQSEGEDILYMQAPNVPKDQVRDCLRKRKIQFQKEKARVLETTPTTPMITTPAPSASLSAPAAAATSAASSAPLSTTSVTDTFRGGYGDLKGHALAPPQESLKLRQELSDCQEQLHMLHSMVKQLKDDVNNNQNKEVVVTGGAPSSLSATATLPPKSEVEILEEEGWILEVGAALETAEEEKQDSDIEDGDEWVVVQGVLQPC